MGFLYDCGMDVRSIAFMYKAASGCLIRQGHSGDFSGQVNRVLQTCIQRGSLK